jgi:hypothetical protein
MIRLSAVDFAACADDGDADAARRRERSNGGRAQIGVKFLRAGDRNDRAPATEGERNRAGRYDAASPQQGRSGEDGPEA